MKKVFIDAFNKAIQGWKWLLGSISAVSCVFLGVYVYSEKQVGIIVSVLIGLGFILLCFVAKYFFEFFRCYRAYRHFIKNETVYGDAIILLKDSFALINSFRKGPYKDRNFLLTSKYTCENLKKIFDKKTGSVCSVSIKVPKSGTVTESAIVENLCRDTSHSTRDTTNYKKKRHTIIDNSGYTDILNSVQKREESNFHYINQNIPKSINYKNSSKGLYTNGTLPYKSELIYPIVPIRRTKPEHYNIWGFICIDCEGIDAFDAKYDKAIIEGVADGVHDIMVARHSFKTKQYGKR